MADALQGRGVLRMCGRSVVALERPSAADFARRSAYSFPATSL